MTRWNLFSSLFLLFALLLNIPRTAHAAESYDNCTGFITSLPAVISTGGTWCLKKDLSTAMTSGNAIDIQANNVTIDCNDFKLGGLAAGSGTFAWGIHANDRANATVRHCNVRGFNFGLFFQNASASKGHVIEDNRFEGNTFVAIQLEGDASVIRRNRLLNTGGSTVPGGSRFAMYIIGSVDILDNTVSGVVAHSGSNGNANGIVAYDKGSISGNRVRGLLKDGTGVAQAILNNAANDIVLRNNDLAGDGSTGSVGLSCVETHARAKDNVINGFATGLTGCSDDGGNVVAP